MDRRFRRRGIGGMLMERGMTWAARQGLAGIMVETQDNNVRACRFYESCGFVLKGFDTGLYHTSQDCRGETALFWYLVPDGPDNR